MKQIIAVIGLLIVPFRAFTQIDDCSYTQFYKDSIYFTLGENVNIRLNPDTAGKILYQTSIGEKVKIIENTQIPYTKNGYTANWYRVVYNNKGYKSEGYIWGGFIATQGVKSLTDNGLMYLYGITKVIKQEYYDEVYICVRAVKDGKQVTRMDLRAIGGLRTFNFAESIGNKGVDKVVDILKINFSDGYCGGSFGDIYLFWDGKALYHAQTLTEGFDAPYSATNQFIFPSDEKGKKGYIINKSESGFYGDDDKFHLEEWEKITYKWDGSKLIAVKTEKKK